MKLNLKSRKFIIISAAVLVLLVVGLVLILCSGISDDPNVAKKTLMENDYRAELYKNGPDVETWKNANNIDVDGLEHVIVAFAEISDDGSKVFTDEYTAENVVYIFYFKDADSAKNAYDTIEKLMNDFASKSESSEEFSINDSGNMIWFGTSDAISAAK